MVNCPIFRTGYLEALGVSPGPFTGVWLPDVLFLPEMTTRRTVRDTDYVKTKATSYLVKVRAIEFS